MARRLGRRPDLPRPPAAVSAFADAFVDFAVSGIFFPTATASTPSPPTTTTTTTSPPTTFLPSPLASSPSGTSTEISPSPCAALRLAGLVPPSNGADAPSTSWSAGPTLALQLGDILDRGGDEIRLLYLLRRSASPPPRGRRAAAHPRNHEIMNVYGDFRFATPQGLKEFSAWAAWYRAGLAIKRRCSDLDHPKNPFLGVPKAFPGIKPEYWDGIRSRLAALRPDGPIARRFLADLPTVLVVGDSVFVHGGLLEANVEYGLERINAEVSEWIRGRGPNAGVPEYVLAETRWSGSGSPRASIVIAKAGGILGMIPGAKRMIMGHTIQTEGITAVWRAGGEGGCRIV
ncbi:hypothetical protein GUJ93_ZPchr0011g27151 [Zizania palustris]|uniref:Shewanella-like protein phosphatase 2 n=1 Tax=Zizania palustris TaxID=103762 RepID=A0A8J6BPU6_ZIZPA|nr:hypothetical protein GUJ93_ZPchr0011g27151 [Zizania palustris]